MKREAEEEWGALILSQSGEQGRALGRDAQPTPTFGDLHEHDRHESHRTRAAIARTWNRAAVHTLHPSERPRCSKRFSRCHFGIIGPQTRAIIDALEDEGPVS